MKWGLQVLVAVVISSAAFAIGYQVGADRASTVSMDLAGRVMVDDAFADLDAYTQALQAEDRGDSPKAHRLHLNRALRRLAAAKGGSATLRCGEREIALLEAASRLVEARPDLVDDDIRRSTPRLRLLCASPRP